MMMEMRMIMMVITMIMMRIVMGMITMKMIMMRRRDTAQVQWEWCTALLRTLVVMMSALTKQSL